MSEYDLPHEISLAVVDAEEYVLGLQATVAVGRWSGRTEAYTTPATLEDFATTLGRFVERCQGEAAFEAGAENGIGLVALRFYAIDRARHLACHVRLASHTATGHRPEEVFHLAIEAQVETSSVLAFSRALRELARRRSGEAKLVTEAAT